MHYVLLVYICTSGWSCDGKLVPMGFYDTKAECLEGQASANKYNQASCIDVETYKSIKEQK